MFGLNQAQIQTLNPAGQALLSQRSSVRPSKYWHPAPHAQGDLVFFCSGNVLATCWAVPYSKLIAIFGFTRGTRVNLGTYYLVLGSCPCVVWCAVLPPAEHPWIPAVSHPVPWRTRDCWWGGASRLCTSGIKCELRKHSCISFSNNYLLHRITSDWKLAR